MANKIKGLTIEIGGDVQPLNKALGEVNKHSKDIQSELRQVERLLKLDPKNTELLAQKQKLLTDAVSTTKEKLDTLREAQRQVQEQFERGEVGEDQYRAIQREVIKAEQELKKLEKQLSDVNNKWKNTAETLDKFGKKTTEIGKNMTTKVTAPIVGAAAASMVAWNEVDDALDTIVTKTGATGEAMEGLEKSFRNVAKSMPVNMQAVGDAIGEVNTQFGLTGTKLEEATAQMLKFAEINGQDVTSASIDSKEAIEAFELSIDNLNDVLDAVTKTAQNTGVGTDKLFDSVVRGAPQLKALRLNFAQATELMGSFEQKGIDSSKALSYLSKAQVEFAKDGKTMNEGLEELVNLIQNSTNETEALTLASKVFGTKGATFMLDAIKRGALNFNDFTNAASEAAGAVSTTFEGTLDPVDNFTTALNNIKLVGSDIATTIQEVFAPALEGLVSNLQGAADWFRNLSPEMQQAIVIIAGIVAAIGPLLVVVGQMSIGLSSIIGLFGGTTAAAGATTAATGGLSAVIGALTGPIGIAIAAVAAITAVIVTLWKTNEDFRENVKKIWAQIQEIFKSALNFIQKLINDIFNGIQAFLDRHGENIKKITSGVWNTISSIVNSVLKIIQGILDTFIGLFTGDWERFTNGIKTIWSGMWNGIRGIIAGAWSILSGAFGILKGSISGWFLGLVENAKNWGRNMISGFIDGINSMIGNVKNAVSGVASKVADFIGFSSPTKEGPGQYIVDWGYNMIEGFMDGVNKALPGLEKTLNTAIPNLSQNISNSTTHNNNNKFIVNAVIRNDSDIKKLAKELFSLQQQASRGRGLAPL